MLTAIPLILKVIEAAQAAIPAGSKALGEFKDLKAKLQIFVDEDRDPTPEEFRELQAQTNALTDRLEAANRRLNG